MNSILSGLVCLFFVNSVHSFEELPKRLDLTLNVENGHWCGPRSASTRRNLSPDFHTLGYPSLGYAGVPFDCLIQSHRYIHEVGMLTGDAIFYFKLRQGAQQTGTRMVGLGFEFASPQGTTRFRLRGNGIHVVFKTTF